MKQSRIILVCILTLATCNYAYYGLKYLARGGSLKDYLKASKQLLLVFIIALLFLILE